MRVWTHRVSVRAVLLGCGLMLAGCVHGLGDTFGFGAEIDCNSLPAHDNLTEEFREECRTGGSGSFYESSPIRVRATHTSSIAVIFETYENVESISGDDIADSSYSGGLAFIDFGPLVSHDYVDFKIELTDGFTMKCEYQHNMFFDC